MSSGGPSTRRRFLQNTVSFSAAALLAGCGKGNFFDQPEVIDPITGGPSHFLMVGDWGTETDYAEQTQVGQSMQAYVAKHSLTTDALLMLGDNFYGALPGGATCPRWQTQFEDIYPASSFNCPAFAVPGNHDYQVEPIDKYAAEIAYSATGGSRWTMPSRYSRFTWPPQSPNVTFITLDSNMPNEPAQPFPFPDASYYTPTDAQRLEQLEWFTQTLQQPLTTPFLVIMAHHPLYSNGPHGDNQTLIRDWDPLLRQSKAHLYIGGHDHDLQHLEFAGHPTSFFLSGGGGAVLDGLVTGNAARGPFAQEVHGFSHLQIEPTLMTCRHLDIDGGLLHKFTKTPDGVVTILK